MSRHHSSTQPRASTGRFSGALAPPLPTIDQTTNSPDVPGGLPRISSTLAEASSLRLPSDAEDTPQAPSRSHHILSDALEQSLLGTSIGLSTLASQINLALGSPVDELPSDLSTPSSAPVDSPTTPVRLPPRPQFPFTKLRSEERRVGKECRS